MVVRLRKRTNRAAQSKLELLRLEFAVREVRGELERPLWVVGLCFFYAPMLEFDGDAKEVFARRGDQCAPLPVARGC